MVKDDTASTGTRALAYVLLAVIVAGFAIAFFVERQGSDEDSPVASAPEAGDTPAEEPTDVAEGASETPVAESTAVTEPVPEVVPESPDPAPPVFDVVRVEPDGSTVIAGRAEPGSKVTLRVDGEAVMDAEADERGNFAAILTLGASEVPRTVSLGMTGVDGTEVASDQTVVVAAAPPAEVTETVTQETPTTTDVAEAAHETSDVVADTAAEGTSAPANDTAVETASSTTEAAPVETSTTESAPLVLMADSDGLQVIQSGGEVTADTDRVVVDAITYDPTGEVSLSGRASQGEGFVRLYIDNDPLLTVPVGPDGRWRTDLPNVDTGVYTLRVDEVDAGGGVLSRIETPFKREAIADIRALDIREGGEAPRAPIALVTVQPGNTLWGIASGAYGDGPSYVRVFEANRSRIRNPDLIYPGQIFTLPN